MKKKLMFLGMLALLLPIRVMALTGSPAIECDNIQLKVGETAQCYVKGKNFTDSVAAFHGKVVVDSKLSLVQITKDSIWEGSADGGVIDVYTDVNKNGNFNIASFQVKALEEGEPKVSLTEIEVTDSQFVGNAFANVSRTINVSSGGNTPTVDPQPSSPTSHDNIVDNPPTAANLIWIVAGVAVILLVVIVMVVYKKGNKNEQ